MELTMQTLLASVMAFLTMMGCGLGDALADLIAPPFSDEVHESVITDLSSPESAAMQFIGAMTAGNYISASTYLCAEAVPGFLALDPASNILLGADASGLIPVVQVTGDTATLNFDGEVILDPGTADEFPIPGELIPYSDIAMIQQNGVWLLCPSELVE